MPDAPTTAPHPLHIPNVQRLDGPVGTSLWLPLAKIARAPLTHPAAVEAVHISHVQAGAEAILTATFALPFLLAHSKKNSKKNAEALFHAALACAEKIAVPRWISLGPPAANHRIPESVLTWAAGAVREGRALGVWLETCRTEDAVWLAAATAYLGRRKVEFVVTFAAHAEEARRLLLSQPKARAVGLNCGLRLFDESDARALAAVTQTRVFKPALRIGAQRMSAQRAKELAHLARADWVGLCCGATAADLQALA